MGLITIFEHLVLPLEVQLLKLAPIQSWEILPRTFILYGANVMSEVVLELNELTLKQ